MRRGVVAEFDSPHALVRAYDALKRDGHRLMRTWTPFAIKAVVKDRPESTVPYLMLGAGLFGGVFAYLLQWWCNGKDFPIDVGGRPLNSAPAFIPITFETTVLAASLVGFFAALGLCGLPRLHHPLFQIEGFERATVDRFWIGVDEADPLFYPGLREKLLRLGALRAEQLGGGEP